MSSQMLWYTDVKTTKLIRIRLTKEFLVVFVRLGQVPSALSTPSFLEVVLPSWLQYLAVQHPKLRRHLIVFSNGTQGLHDYVRRIFRGMQRTDILSAWTVDVSQYREQLSEIENTSACLDTFKTVKRL